MRAFSQYSFHQDQSSRTAATLKDPERMRLKLVFISSVVAAALGAGSSIAIILYVSSSLKPMTAPGLYPEHDLFIQLMKLKNTLRHLKGEELITHLGLEYYD